MVYDVKKVIYILFGGDDFSLKEALKRIKSEWETSLLEANTTSLEGQSLTLNELVAACQTAPFFCPKRLVIISGLLSRFEPKRGQLTNEEEAERFASALKGVPESTVLVLIEDRLSEDNPLFYKLKPIVQVKSFPPLKGSQLHAWIRRRVNQGGGDISSKAVRLLTEIAGENLWTLSREIEKLLLFAQDRVIEEEDVKELVSSAYEVSIFRLIDALLQGQTAEAGRWLHHMLQRGAKPPYILTMLARQLRLLVQAKELWGQRLSNREVRDRLGLSGYALERTLTQAKGYTSERIKEIYQRLLETDLAIKTGKWEGKLALDLLLMELSRI